MSELLPNIRNAARALIIRDGNILLLKKQYEDGRIAFVLPGGGQDTGESLSNALMRECREELGVEVEVIDLLHVADYFKNSESSPNHKRHMLELLFHCTVPASYTATVGPSPDKYQVDVVWEDINNVGNISFCPSTLAKHISAMFEENSKVYLEILE